MPPKKQQKNGFFYFMQEEQNQIFRNSGRRVPMRSMPGLSGPKWSAMTELEKAPYVAKAKQEKKNPNGVVRDGRRDNHGELLSERKDALLELEERREREGAEIKKRLAKGREAAMQEFYFVDFQYLAELPDDETDLPYQPVEIGLVKYSIESGIASSIQKFIDPGKIPLGYRCICQMHSDKTHKIPLDGFPLAETNYREILSEIERFINPSQSHQRPPLFAPRLRAQMSEQCLLWMAEQSGIACIFSVYELETLIKLLCDNIDPESNMTIHIAERNLSTEAWNYSSGIRCPYHHREDIQHCSLAAVKKYCFVMSEELCSRYNVSITDRHLPQEESSLGIITTYQPTEVAKPKDLPQRSWTAPVGRGAVREQSRPTDPRLSKGRGRGIMGLGVPKVPRTPAIPDVTDFEQDEQRELHVGEIQASIPHPASSGPLLQGPWGVRPLAPSYSNPLPVQGAWAMGPPQQRFQYPQSTKPPPPGFAPKKH